MMIPAEKDKNKINSSESWSQKVKTLYTLSENGCIKTVHFPSVYRDETDVS